MRNLYDILIGYTSRHSLLEGILNSDDKVTQDLIGEEATAKLHYQLFMDYVGDLLYSETFYQNFSGEINFLIKDQKSYITEVYKRFDKTLNKYFKEIKRIHKDKYVRWVKCYEFASEVYKLTIDKENYIFKVCNRRNRQDNRLIRVQSPENKPFMLP